MVRKTPYGACMALASLAGLAIAAPPSHAAQFTTLYKFTSPTRTQGVDGTLAVLGHVLYGTTEEGGTGPESDGRIFKFDLGSRTETTLVNFTGVTGAAKGQAPTGPLSIVGHWVYGSTAVGGRTDNIHGFGLGEIWKLNALTGNEAVFHAFDNTDGDQPLSGVTPVNGVFYGVTQFGGRHNAGTVFKLDTTGTLTELYTFPDTTIGCNPTAGVIVVGSILYGTTSSCGAGGGSVFSLDLVSRRASVLHFFANTGQNINSPNALIAAHGALYGTTFDDGGAGTVYKIDIATGRYTLLHQFGAAGDGINPTSGLTPLQGKFFGVTQSGGAFGVGTIYRIDPATGSEAVVHSFTGGRDGDSPGAGLLATKAALYGSTLNTTSDNQGTLFVFAP